MAKCGSVHLLSETLYCYVLWFCHMCMSVYVYMVIFGCVQLLEHGGVIVYG